MSYSEQPLFIPGDTPLYAVITNASEQKGAFLVVTGFGEEKKSSYRNIVDLCRYAAGNGISSLRFDLSGTGDSDSDISKLSIDNWFFDIRLAYNYLVEHTGMNCSVVALRLGCLLAVSAALEPVSYVLIAPPQSGSSYMREELMRRQLRAAMCGLPREASSVFDARILKEGSADFDGIQISSSLYYGIRSLSWEPAESVKQQCSIIYTGKQGTTPSEIGQVALKFRSSPLLTGIETMPFWNTTDYVPLHTLSESVTDFLRSSEKSE